MKIAIVAAYNTQVDMTKEFLDRMQESLEDSICEVYMILVHGVIGDEPDIKHPFIDEHITCINESFCKTLNHGLLHVPEDTDYVFFVGNDSFPVTEGWLDKLIELEIKTEGKLICPANDKPGMGAYGHLYREDCGEYWLADFFPSVAWLIPMDVFKEIGYLDEDYVNSCMYADNDYCKRIELKYGSNQIVVSKDILLEHRVSVEGKLLHNVNSDMGVNQKIFTEKFK